LRADTFLLGSTRKKHILNKEDPSILYENISLNFRLTDLAWLQVLLASIGEQFLSDALCGASVSVRKNESVISLWNNSLESVDLPKVEALIRVILSGVAILEVSFHGLLSFIPWFFSKV
jgi:hypothetical protein